MESKGCDIPTPIKVLGWGLVGLVALYFYKEFLEYPNAKSFLEKQGSLIAGIIAFAAAVIALYSQRESVQRQLSSQRKMEEDKLFREKLEEMYSFIQELRINATLTRTYMIKDHVRDIDIFNKDIGRIVMLQRLYRVADKKLFQEYSGSVYEFLEVWSNFARDYVMESKDGLDKEIDPEELQSRFIDFHSKSDIFFKNTDKFLVYLSSLIVRQE